MVASIIETLTSNIIPILYAIICAVGIAGNSLVVYVILSISSIPTAKLSFLKRNRKRFEKSNGRIEIEYLKERKFRKQTKNKEFIFLRLYKRLKCLKLSVTNYYLINLAISDFILLFFIIFLIITVILKKWIFGLILCKIYFSIVYICQLNAAFIISFLSLNRWIAVRFPLLVKRYINLFITRIIIFLCWTLSIILSIPVMVLTTIFHLKENNETSEEKFFCIIAINPNVTNHTFLPEGISPLKAFQFYWLTINFILPVTLIIIFYMQVLRLLKLNKNDSRLNVSTNRIKLYKKITTMCLVIIACYVICWTPYWTIQIILSIDPHFAENSIFVLIFSLAQIIAYLNSVLNPIIYSCFSEDFRSNFRMAWCFCKKK